jgi:mRNA interferase RelE/StbE
MASALIGFVYSESALDYLQTLQKKTRRQIVEKIEALANDPLPPGHKMLKGMKDDEERVYRIRSGDYRVLYVLRANPRHIVILDIDHRKDIYR